MCIRDSLLQHGEHSFIVSGVCPLLHFILGNPGHATMVDSLEQILLCLLYTSEGGYVVAATPEEALALAKEKTGNADLKLEDLRQDEDCLDTWFSSWSVSYTHLDVYKRQATKKSTGKREDVAPAIQNQAASTTLGDIDALAALKEQMEAGKK